MKKLLYFLPIFMLSACDPGNNYVFIVKNNSNYPIKISAYRKDKGVSPNPSEEISIMAHNEWSAKRNISLREYPFLFKDNYTDSIRIVFDKRKVIIKTCNKMQFYSCGSPEEDFAKFISSNDKKKIVRTYEFTDEDYKKATSF